MPTLLKRFTLNDLPSENGTISNPVFMDGKFLYRSARPPFRENYLDKTLKQGTYNDRYEVNLKSIENVQYSDFHDDLNLPFLISDTRLFKYQNKLYFNITAVNYAQNDYGYISQIAIASLDERRIIRIDFKGRPEVEKNYSFFEYNEKLFFFRGLWGKATHIYQVDPITGEACLAYKKGYVSQYDVDALGCLKITSSPITRDKLCYVNLHSHTHTLPHTYNCAMMAFENSPPFDVKHISNVPLFNIQGTQIIYPIGLSNGEKNKGDFIIGFGLADYETMDLVSISHDELFDHFTNDVTFEYPAKLYPMQTTDFAYLRNTKPKASLKSIIKRYTRGNG